MAMYLTESLSHSQQRTAFPKAFLARLGIQAEYAAERKEVTDRKTRNRGASHSESVLWRATAFGLQYYTFLPTVQKEF